MCKSCPPGLELLPVSSAFWKGFRLYPNVRVGKWLPLQSYASMCPWLAAALGTPLSGSESSQQCFLMKLTIQHSTTRTIQVVAVSRVKGEVGLVMLQLQQS